MLAWTGPLGSFSLHFEMKKWRQFRAVYFRITISAHTATYLLLQLPGTLCRRYSTRNIKLAYHAHTTIRLTGFSFNPSKHANYIKGNNYHPGHYKLFFEVGLPGVTCDREPIGHTQVHEGWKELPVTWRMEVVKEISVG